MKRYTACLPVLLISVLAFFLMATPNVSAQFTAYPAGAQQGTTVEVLLAGIGVNNAIEVIVPGGGVETKILRRPRNGGFLFQDPYMGKCSGIMRAIFDEERRLAPIRAEENPAKLEEARRVLRVNRKKRKDATPVAINDIPTPDDEEFYNACTYFHRMENPSMEDLQLIYYEYIAPNFDRFSGLRVANSLVIELKVAPDAKPGWREIKVYGPNGFIRPGWFLITDMREITELEPNEGDTWPEWEGWFNKKYVSRPLQELPVGINGQIKPGDIDRFTIHCKEGQQLVFDMRARSLKPYMADGVPGWFCGLIRLFDPEGRELKSGDSYRFSLDPMMFYRVPKTGEYTVEVRDAIFRGRNDFVYHLAIGEFPVISSCYPLGGPVDSNTIINLRGGNLSSRTIAPDFKGPVAYDEIRSIDTLDGKPLYRPMKYMVETLPIVQEPMPSKIQQVRNNREPIEVETPTVIYGLIATPAETDIYTFKGKKGQKIVLEVKAQALGSNLDSVVEIRDSQGKVLGMNDDRADSKGPNIGLEVHHSDSLLMVQLPEDGQYSACIYNNSRKSGVDYFYRLRISEPQPDFFVVMTPSQVRFNGANASFKVQIFRTEDFDGEVQLKFVNNEDLIISGKGIIKGEPAIYQPPKDGQYTRTTSNICPMSREHDFSVKASKKLDPNPQPLILEATATIGGKTVTHRVIPADDWEQAFIYHHLVPTDYLYGSQR